MHPISFLLATPPGAESSPEMYHDLLLPHGPCLLTLAMPSSALSKSMWSPSTLRMSDSNDTDDEPPAVLTTDPPSCT